MKPLAWVPSLATDTRTVEGVQPTAPKQVSRTKISPVALVSPFQLDPFTVLPTAIAYLVSLLITFFIIEREDVDWRHGVVLISLFAVFVAWQAYIGA